MTETTFRALLLTQDDDRKTHHQFETLTLDDLPEGDVLVKVQYSSLNYKDGLAVTGSSPVVRSFPMVGGIDFVGTVEASDDDKDSGDRDSRDRGRQRAPAPDAGDDDSDDNGRRRRRGRRGGRRVREDTERDGFTWVRGRTPSLTDPYVWFDPLNPHGDSDTSESKGPSSDRPDTPPANEDSEGEREGGRRRRRRRGRGRDRTGSDEASPRAEARAANEGMIDEVPVDTAVTDKTDTGTNTADADAADLAPSVPVTEPDATAEPAPKRRRVRRKAVAVDSSDDQQPAATVADPVEVSAEPAPAADPAPVSETPAAQEAPAPDDEVAVTPQAPTRKTVDVEEILANDPNQITAPAPKPKRGWWRL